MAVHTELGCGFLEVVYKAALATEFRRRNIAFAREVGLPLAYKGEPLGLLYRVDFISYQSVIVEVKAHEALTPLDLAQTINYLRGRAPAGAAAELWRQEPRAPSRGLRRARKRRMGAGTLKEPIPASSRRVKSA